MNQPKTRTVAIVVEGRRISLLAQRLEYLTGSSVAKRLLSTRAALQEEVRLLRPDIMMCAVSDDESRLITWLREKRHYGVEVHFALLGFAGVTHRVATKLVATLTACGSDTEMYAQ